MVKNQAPLSPASKVSSAGKCLFGERRGIHIDIVERLAAE